MSTILIFEKPRTENTELGLHHRDVCGAKWMAILTLSICAAKRAITRALPQRFTIGWLLRTSTLTSSMITELMAYLLKFRGFRV